MGQDKIKDLFSSKLNNFEPEVPASIWGGLDQILSNQAAPINDPASSTSSTTSSSTSSSTTSTATAAGKATVIKTVALVAGLAAAIATGVFVLTPDKQVLQIEQPAPIIQPVETTIDSIVEIDSLVQIAEPVFATLVQKSTVETPIEEPGKTKEQPLPEIEEIELSKTKEPKNVTSTEAPLVVRQIYDVFSKPITEGLSLGITSNIGLFSADVNERGGGLLMSQNIRSKAFMEALAEENQEFYLKHKQPISFGITVSKELSSRLSLETGFIYTHLSSELTSGSMLQIKETQTFDYIGVPLSLNYKFYKFDKAYLYLSVGGMIQKDIRGQLVSNMIHSLPEVEGPGIFEEVFPSEPSYIKKRIKQLKPQFSIISSVGISYPLYKKLYLYGTIGGAYYFDVGNRYRTIYSDKKTQLDLNLGIKFDF
ncbi:MAG: hypothetical protein LBV43_03490 [Prevotella sp.]|nr:hypothetical protein [Prevotella sp.]